MAVEQRRLSVEVFGQSMLMHGSLDSARRLTDLLNEGEPYLHLQQVSAYPYAADTIIGLERHDSGIINKASIVMLAELEAAGGAPALADEAGVRVPKNAHRILVYTSQFAINGDIHLTEGVDMAHFLSVTPTQFVPLTNATVLPLQAGSQLTSFRRGFLLINRDHIGYLGTADHDGTPAVDRGDDSIG